MPRNLINITLGTAGHIDHGKTALIKCLTGCETDRLKEEKERGMSIELGYAPCTLGSLEVGIVDVPGHENFIRTMVAGASGIDACMLAVAADDGPMPQTREHLDILTLLDVRCGVVVLTKIDRVSAEEQQLAQQIVAEFVRGTFLENAPIVPVSNVTGDGLGALYETLSDMVRTIQPRSVDGVFRLPVERSFSARGFGTIIAGVPTAGAAHVDDEVILLPDGLTGRIKSIQAYGQDSPTAMTGQCAAINIRHWDHRVVERGKTLTIPGFFEPHTCCVGYVRMLPHERIYLKHGSTVRFHTGTTERIARVYVMESNSLGAGQTALIQFRFEEPIVAGPRDRFIIRELSPARTIGGGVIIETLQRRLNRTEPGLIERLSQQLAAIADDQSFVVYCTATSNDPMLTTSAIAHRAKVPIARTAAMLESLVADGSLIRASEGQYVHRHVADELAQQLLARLTEYHRATPTGPGITLEELRQMVASTVLPANTVATSDEISLASCSSAVLQAVVEMLRSAGKIAVGDQKLTLSTHQAAAQDEQSRRLQQLEALFQTRAFRPPEPAEIATELAIPLSAVTPLLRALIEQKRLVRIDRDLLFHADAVAQARASIVEHIRTKGRLESVDFKYLVDTTRKYAMPLLDYFDRIGLTRRCSDNTRLLR